MRYGFTPPAVAATLARMRMKPKVKAADAVLAEILADDAAQPSRSRRTFPPELAEAIGYYLQWGRSRNRLEALIELATPLAGEVVSKVRSIGTEDVTQTVTKSAETKPRSRR